MGSSSASLVWLRGVGEKTQGEWVGGDAGCLGAGRGVSGPCGLELCPRRAQARGATAGRAGDISTETGRTSRPMWQDSGRKPAQPLGLLVAQLRLRTGPAPTPNRRLRPDATEAGGKMAMVA